MHNDYFSYLDYRAAQRRLAARFARPYGLLLHALAFVVAMSAVWAYGIAARLWYYPDNFRLPVLIGVVWSMVLAAHALIHYRRSPANNIGREVAVEEQMRHLIAANADQVDDDTLFAMHRRLEAELEGQARGSVALLAFALVNFLSWGVSALDVGTSWPFQMTLPLAVIVIGGVYTFLSWQGRRALGQSGWFTRLPVRHIAIYGLGVIGLGVAGAFRMINFWDADNGIKVWSVVVLLHILVSVVVWPLIRRFVAGEPESEQPLKRKPPARLVLADDGEVLEIEEDPWSRAARGQE